MKGLTGGAEGSERAVQSPHIYTLFTEAAWLHAIPVLHQSDSPLPPAPLPWWECCPRATRACPQPSRHGGGLWDLPLPFPRTPLGLATSSLLHFAFAGSLGRT